MSAGPDYIDPRSKVDRSGGVAVESNRECSLKIAEEDLIQASQAGDEVAFESLYKTYRGPIHHFITRLCGNPDYAEDLTQDSFIRLWEKIGQFKFESSL